MKKIALSIAISSIVATGASAATVLEQDGFKLDVQGDIQIQLRKDTSDGDELFMDYDDAEIKFKPSYMFDNGLTAFGAVEADFKGESDQGVTSDSLDDAYVGLSYENLTFRAGTYWLDSDGFGIGQDIEFGTAHALGNTYGTEAIRAAFSNDQLTVALTHDLEEAADSGTTELFASYAIDALTVQGIYKNQTAAFSGFADDVNSYGIAVSYAQDLFTIGAEFTGSDAEGVKVNADPNDLTVSDLAVETAYEISGTYAATDMVTLGAGFGQSMFEADGTDTMTQYYVNGVYSLNSNVAAFAELGGNDLDDSELGYLLGMKVTF